MENTEENWFMMVGYEISADTGKLCRKDVTVACTGFFNHAVEGDEIRILCHDYQYRLSVYSMDRDDKFLYTYAYQEEECWARYSEKYSMVEFTQKPYSFPCESYFRITISRTDSKCISEQDVNPFIKILKWKKGMIKKKQMPLHFLREIEKTKQRISKIATEDSLAFVLLSDSHNVVNGFWKDTKENIQYMISNSHLRFNGIIHLGDCTDGMVCGDMTRK